MIHTHLRISAVVLALGTGACSHRTLTRYGEFGALPADSVLRTHPALGCFRLEHGAWKPPIPDSEGLYIPPPPVVRLSDHVFARLRFQTTILSELELKPDVYMSYDHQHAVQAYWEPYPTSDSLELTWRLGDAGTSILLRRMSDQVWAGYVFSWYDFPQTTIPKAPVTARRVGCTDADRARPPN